MLFRSPNLIEVTKTGTGFLLIKRDVFDKLNQHPAVRHFNNDIGLPETLNPFMKTYFDTAVRENRYYSEDWTFCENWRDLGGEVWVDKRVLLKHTGTYVFDYGTHEQLYKDLRVIFDPAAAAAATNGQPTTAAVPVTDANVTADKPAETPKGKTLASNKSKKAKKETAAA